MQLMIHRHYGLLFFKNDNFKYRTTSQGRSFNSVSLFHIFYLVFFQLSLFKLLCTKNITSIINITLRSFYYVMYYIVSEICIAERFLWDSFYCYSQQFISAVANEFLIPNNLKKGHQKHITFNTVTPNANPNQSKKI